MKSDLVQYTSLIQMGMLDKAGEVSGLHASLLQLELVLLSS